MTVEKSLSETEQTLKTAIYKTKFKCHAKLLILEKLKNCLNLGENLKITKTNLKINLKYKLAIINTGYRSARVMTTSVLGILGHTENDYLDVWGNFLGGKNEGNLLKKTGTLPDHGAKNVKWPLLQEKKNNCQLSLTQPLQFFSHTPSVCLSVGVSPPMSKPMTGVWCVLAYAVRA